jgi:hypothetical protein
VIQNWAVLLTVYGLLHEFLIERQADATLPLWRDCLSETVQAVQQERAGRQFLDLLGQLIAGGSCVLEPLRPDPHNPDLATKATIVGYRDERYVYLLPNVALREVEKMQPIHFTATAISGQLKEDGILIDSGSDAHRGVQIRVRETRVRVWRLRGDCFGGDSGDNGANRS